MSNTETSAEIDKVVLICYAEFMKRKSIIIPTAAEIYEMVKYYMDVNCYDLIYEDVYKIMTKDLVKKVLQRYQFVHKADGIIYFEAQNLLIEDWFYYEILMKGE